MLDNFEAIKNDPRSKTGVFIGLKRNTTYATGEILRSFCAAA